MKPSPVFSTQKMIVLVAFLSAATLTSLLIFHLRQAPSSATPTPYQGIWFSLAREMNFFKWVNRDNKKLTQAFKMSMQAYV